MPWFTRQTESSDDAGWVWTQPGNPELPWYNSGTITNNISESFRYFGYDGVHWKTRAFIRFPNIFLVRGTPLQTAELRLYGAEMQWEVGSSIALTISFHNIADTIIPEGTPWGFPYGVPTWNQYLAFPRTDTITWSNVNWPGEKVQFPNVPDVAAILQQVISRDDWVHGNDVLLLVEYLGVYSPYSIIPFYGCDIASQPLSPYKNAEYWPTLIITW